MLTCLTCPLATCLSCFVAASNKLGLWIDLIQWFLFFSFLSENLNNWISSHQSWHFLQRGSASAIRLDAMSFWSQESHKGANGVQFKAVNTLNLDIDLKSRMCSLWSFVQLELEGASELQKVENSCYCYRIDRCKYCETDGNRIPTIQNV